MAHTKWSPAYGILAVLVGIAALLSNTVAYLEERGGHPPPTLHEDALAPGDGFPTVDWGYWQEVNPDVIGWITIEGTGINHPVVQAHEDDPQYYLTHDVYRKWNFTGCPYLDSGCAAEGFLHCRNSIVFGHNMGWNRDIFADLELFSDEPYARAHSSILVQTPTSKVRKELAACAIVPGWENSKRTEFADDADFNSWWSACRNRCDVQIISEATLPDPLLTLCTCSYGKWENERTLVYFS